MHRVLIPPEAIRGRTITVSDPTTLHHLVDVLRVRMADPVECFDGTGARYAGVIVRRGRRKLVIEVCDQREDPPPKLRVTLAQALMKPERFDWMVQKATELGVERIAPLVTDRTIVRVSHDQVPARVARWRRIAEEAARQCGRATVPDVDPPQDIERVLASLDRRRPVLMPTLAGATQPLSQAVEGLRDATAVAVAIGPEGDFTPDETEHAKRHGASLVSLGRLTLRSETAAVVMLSILRYASGAL